MALKIAVKVIKNFEGCNLIAYPDPKSDLYKALLLHNMLNKYMSGKILWKDLPDNFKALSGTPWTCGWGETQGVTKDTVFTQEEADTKLVASIQMRAEAILKAVPELETLSDEKIAACVSLAYNIGISAFKTSTVAKCITAGDLSAAAEAFMLWNKPSMLIGRRTIERNLFLSVA